MEQRCSTGSEREGAQGGDHEPFAVMLLCSQLSGTLPVSEHCSLGKVCVQQGRAQNFSKHILKGRLNSAAVRWGNAGVSYICSRSSGVGCTGCNSPRVRWGRFRLCT